MKLTNIFAKNAVPVFYTAGSTIFEIGQPRDSLSTRRGLHETA
jgi:hypothetical protein